MGLTQSAGLTLIDVGQAPLLARPYCAEGDPGPILTQTNELLTPERRSGAESVG
jgi:hypothetical protein